MGETGANEDVAGRQPVGSAWRLPAQTLGAITCGAAAIIGLAALAGAVDLASLGAETEESTANREPNPELNPGRSQPEPSTGSVSGTSGDVDGITLGRGDGQVRIDAIPGCPGGISINDEILVVPDPEACGFRPIEPGETIEETGQTILVPDERGAIGGVQIGDDGEVRLVPVDEVDEEAIRIDRESDGSITITGVDDADGQPVRIDVTDEQDFQVTAPDGSDLDLDLAGGETAPEPETDSSETESRDDPGAGDERDNDPPDLSFLFPILVLLVITGLIGLCIVLAKSIAGIRIGGSKPAPPNQPDHGAPSIEPTVGPDYSNEINAINRLLWEIEQERDPRRAIQRVYAAVETGLGNEALARRTSETPGVYLRRVLGRDRTLQPPLETLTLLFEQARFSQHEITPEMRDLAIASLQTIRAQFQALSAKPAAYDSEVLV